jgi:hypothetical protein
MNPLEDLVLLYFIGTILLVCDTSLDSWKRIPLRVPQGARARFEPGTYLAAGKQAR